ncbi:MAG: hypothetical protein ACM3JC_10845 [Rudaea sp.]
MVALVASAFAITASAQGTAATKAEAPAKAEAKAGAAEKTAASGKTKPKTISVGEKLKQEKAKKERAKKETAKKAKNSQHAAVDKKAVAGDSKPAK